MSVPFQTPVHIEHVDGTPQLTGADGKLIAELEIVTYAELAEIAKRINMHDDLVAAVRGLLRRYPESGEAGAYTHEGAEARRLINMVDGLA